MPTNLKYRARERQRKRESRRQPAKLNEKKDDRDLEREQRRHFLLEKQHENFVAAVTKFEMLSDTNTRRKYAAVKKSEQERVRNFLHKKKVSGSFPLNSCKTTAKKCTKKCAARAKVPFLLIRPIVVFHRSPVMPSPLSNYTILYFV